MPKHYWKAYLNDFLATGKPWQEVPKPFPEYATIVFYNCVTVSIVKHNLKSVLRACWHDNRVYLVRCEAYEQFRESHPSEYKTKHKRLINSFIASNDDVWDVTEHFNNSATQTLYHVAKLYGNGIVKARIRGSNSYIYRVKTRD